MACALRLSLHLMPFSVKRLEHEQGSLSQTDPVRPPSLDSLPDPLLALADSRHAPSPDLRLQLFKTLKHNSGSPHQARRPSRRPPLDLPKQPRVPRRPPSTARPPSSSAPSPPLSTSMTTRRASSWSTMSASSRAHGPSSSRLRSRPGSCPRSRTSQCRAGRRRTRRRA